MSLAEVGAGFARAAGADHLAGMLAQARATATGPVPAAPAWSRYRRYAETGDRRDYETGYFARRGHLNATAVTALVDGAPQAYEALADALWSVCDEWTWALPAHAWLVEGTDRAMPGCVDLFAAETAHALAEIVALAGDRLPAPVTERVCTEVQRRVLDPYLGDPRPWPWESARHNWSAVCAGAAGLAALALWPESGRLWAALGRCRSAMVTYLSGLGADGGCAEGLDYWVYGFGYFTYFAEALRQRTGEDLLATYPVAAAAAGFPAAVELSPGRFVTFSDATGQPLLPPGLLHRLGDRLAAPLPSVRTVPDLDADHCHRWGHLSRTVAWTDPDRLAGGGDTVGGGWLPELAWLVDRRARGGATVAFAAKGGHNDEPHNHNDLGHFILAAGAEQLLIDLGAGEYRAGYFGADRYAYLHPSAHAHSVPEVAGRVQRAGRAAAATVLGARRGNDGADLWLDLSAAYGVPVRRGFAWRADGSLTLTDDLGTAAEATEVFVSRSAPLVAGGEVAWPGVTATAVLRFDPAGWMPTVERIETRDHHGAHDTVHRLRLRSLTPPGIARFEFRLR